LPNLSSGRSPTKRRGLDGASVVFKHYPCAIWCLAVVLIILVQGCYRVLMQWMI
jgi:hypothetical protein